MPAPRTRTGPKSVSTICIDGSIDLPPGAVQAAIDDGLSRLTFGRLAKRHGPCFRNPNSIPRSACCSSQRIGRGRERALQDPGRAVDAGWIEWLANSFDGTSEERRIEAQAAIALVDGLLLMRQLSGPAAADQAAVRLGISPQ